MADEAVVKIVIDGGGGNPPPAASIPPSAPTPAPTPDPTKGMARFYHGTASGAPGDWLTPDLAYAQGYAGKGGDSGKVFYTDVAEDHPSLSKAFDDTGTNMKAPWNNFQAPPDISSKLQPYIPQPPPTAPAPPPPTAPAPPPPTAAAPPPPTDGFSDKVAMGAGGQAHPTQPKADDYSHQVAMGAAGLTPLGLAKKRIGLEEEQRKADAEYAKLNPPKVIPTKPPFDPVALAKKRIEAEEQRQAVDKEYAKLKPKSMLDSLLEVAESLRGTIGGTLGTVAGAGLDITAKIREMRGKGVFGGKEGGSNEPIPAAIPTGLQGSSPADPVASLATAADGAGSKLAAIVPVVGAVAVGATALIAAFRAVTSVIDDMVTRYGEYSPEVAQEQAMAEVRGIMGDMRRAQESGKELAEYVRAQSEMQQKFEDVKVALMQQIIPVVTGIMEVLGGLLGIASRTDIDPTKDPTTLLLQGGMRIPDF